jgi:hypothetical protein
LASVGKTALLVILTLGAVTGVVFYYLAAMFTPQPGVVVSLYRKDLPTTSEEAQANKAAASPAIDESKFTNKGCNHYLKRCVNTG